MMASRDAGDPHGGQLVHYDDQHTGAMHPTSPLQDMAERVGKEVDLFAEKLDKFNSILRSDDAFEAVYELTVEYKTAAQAMAREIRKQHEAQRLHTMRKDAGKTMARTSDLAFGTSSFASGANETHDTQDLEEWQTEADTWELLRILLELRYSPEAGAARTQERERPNHYTSHDDIWDIFTAEDNAARERYLVLKWLQGSADHGDSDIEAIADRMKDKSAASGSLWLDGWMETREKIKGAKRAQFFPPSQPNQLQVRRSDNNELVVTELDPDAPTRQHRTLEQADSRSERVLWMTCWEMLRRGRSWVEICDWCSDHSQTWRAASIGAAANSSRHARIPGASAGPLWRRLCYSLAVKASSDEYEAAVYGMLAGDLDTVKGACKSWDDHLFAYYNSLLLTQFDHYLQRTVPSKSPSSLTTRFPNFDALRHLGSDATAANLIERLKRDQATEVEARLPVKLLQGSLIANTFEQLCINLATVISDTPWYRSSSSVIAPVRKTTGSVDHFDESAIAKDLRTLRMVAHMLILLRKIDPALSNIDTGADNIIAAYIEVLRTIDRRESATLYSSHMSAQRAISSVAQCLSDEVDMTEKMTIINLLPIYHVDAMAVFAELTHLVILNATQDRNPATVDFGLVESTTEDIYPAQRIKLNFKAQASAGKNVADHLMVYHINKGNWDATFTNLAYACRKLLQHGCYLEASQLVRNLPFDTLSTSKSRLALGHSVNVQDHEHIHMLQMDPRQAAIVRVLQKQSQAYYELCLLVRAIDALDNWRQVEHEYLNKTPRPKSPPAKLRRSFEETCAAVEPIFAGILLTAKDEAEAADLADIRARLLPEIVLAYNVVLCAASHMISRDHLMRSMDLATIVANGKNGLADAIIKAGRMKDVVASFAHTSETMLKLNETGKPRKEKKSKTGSNLTVWEIAG